MKPVLAAVFGFGVAFLLAFTAPDTPARHAQVPSSVTVPQLYVHDPYTSLIPNVTPKPAGSCTSSQAIGLYDDGGSVGINCIDVSSGTSTAVTTPAAAPGANQITSFAFQLDAGWPPVPSSIDSFFALMQPTGLYSIFTYYSTTTHWHPFCVLSEGWGSAALVNYNTDLPTTVAGSGSGINWANTSLLTRSKIARRTSTAATNQSAGWRFSGQTGWRGNVAAAGGWLTWQRWAFETTAANNRHMIGLMASTSFPSATADPDTNLNTIYVGCNSGNTNLSICSNDGTGTATCSTLGSSFPCTTNGAFYDLWLAAPPNGAHIAYHIERLDSAARAAGVVTSDLPQNTVQLGFIISSNTGSSSATTLINLGGMCSVANL